MLTVLTWHRGTLIFATLIFLFDPKVWILPKDSKFKNSRFQAFNKFLDLKTVFVRVCLGLTLLYAFCVLYSFVTTKRLLFESSIRRKGTFIRLDVFTKPYLEQVCSCIRVYISPYLNRRVNRSISKHQCKISSNLAE